MKQIFILIASLLTGVVLVAAVLLSVDLAAAQDAPDSGDGIIEMTVFPAAEGTPSAESGIITQVVPLGQENSPAVEEGAISVTVSMDEEGGLPKTYPDAWGVLLQQSDNTFLIGAQSTSFVNGQRSCQPLQVAKKTRILITESTRFVQDATDFGQLESTEGTNEFHVQQVLKHIEKPGALPQCASILAWGNRQGDSLIADVILFHDELN